VAFYYSPAFTADSAVTRMQMFGIHSTITLHAAHPPYLSELIAYCLPSRALHSSNTNLVARPYGITHNFTSRDFSVSATSIWNSLPAHILS